MFMGYGVITGSFLLAAVLALIPMPQWLLWGRPEWVALVLLYWSIALPHKIGIFAALAIGMVMDVLEGAVLGQNALSLAVLALLSLLLYQRLRVFSLWQQSGMVFVMVGMHQLASQWVQTIEGTGARTPLFLLPALTSALLWPVVLQVLRGIRRHYRVS